MDNKPQGGTSPVYLETTPHILDVFEVYFPRNPIVIGVQPNFELCIGMIIESDNAEILGEVTRIETDHEVLVTSANPGDFVMISLSSSENQPKVKRLQKLFYTPS
jgi:hypothetical protein